MSVGMISSRGLSTALFLLILATPPLANYSYAGAESLPEYCSDNNGQITCTIEILGLQSPAYGPEVAEVPVGAEIVVKNVAPEIHTVTSTDNTFDQPGPQPNGIFDTGILRTGESTSFVLDKAGEYYYYCSVHPEDMRGKIVVGGSNEMQVTGTTDPSNNSNTTTSVQEDTTLTGGELPITKISSVGDEAYIIDGTTPDGGHDAFSYDGSGHKRITGHVDVDLDPQGKTGKIEATWTDPEGHEWRFEQTQFAGGNELYIEEVDNETLQTRLASDPIGINHFEHGTTGAGPVVEPTLFVYLASWGPAEVWRNGESLGVFEAHMMVTDGPRDPVSGKIVKSDGETPYSPMEPGDSKVNPYIAQTHLTFHTPAGEMTNNFPPPYESFTHLMFYNIDVLAPGLSEANAELDGETYVVTAMSSDTSLMSVEIVPNESVQVQFDRPGEVELTLPSSMISDVSAVTSGESNIEFEEVSSSDDSTTIKFSVPTSRTVEISGATVVPEFGVIAALILTASLVGVILISRFRTRLPHQWRL